MSTGADCRFYEKKKGEWYFDLQQWPYGENPDYDTHGPFGTFRKAMDHLDGRYANPGGFSSDPLPGCPHDLRDPDDPQSCDRCGDWIEASEVTA